MLYIILNALTKHMIKKRREAQLEVIFNKTVQFMAKVWIEERDARVGRGRNSLLQKKGENRIDQSN
jgi:hypothetical protein